MTAESDSLAADSSHHEVFTLLVKFLRLMKHEALNVGVERARQTLIRSNNDDCRRTGLFLVLDEEGMRVAARRSRQVRNDIANLVSVRTSLTHPILCLAHLRSQPSEPLRLPWKGPSALRYGQSDRNAWSAGTHA